MFNVINYVVDNKFAGIILFRNTMDRAENNDAELTTEYGKQNAACLILRNRGIVSYFS